MQNLKDKSDILNRILGTLSSGRSVFLVGPTDSGKTWFVQNELVPFLEKQSVRVRYFADCDKLPKKGEVNVEVFIVDEVEIIQDTPFLEEIYTEQKPYFSPEYIAKVRQWFSALNRIQKPGVFVVTREKEVIENFVNNIKTLDWNGKNAEVIEFHGK